MIQIGPWIRKKKHIFILNVNKEGFLPTPSTFFNIPQIYRYYDLDGKEMLETYRDNNPLNPNAHRYLYEFQTLNGLPMEDQISSLQVEVSELIDIVCQVYIRFMRTTVEMNWKHLMIRSNSVCPLYVTLWLTS